MKALAVARAAPFIAVVAAIGDEVPLLGEEVQGVDLLADLVLVAIVFEDRHFVVAMVVLDDAEPDLDTDWVGIMMGEVIQYLLVIVEIDIDKVLDDSGQVELEDLTAEDVLDVFDIVTGDGDVFLVHVVVAGDIDLLQVAGVVT